MIENKLVSDIEIRLEHASVTAKLLRHILIAEIFVSIEKVTY